MTIPLTVTEITPPFSQEPAADPRHYTMPFAVGFFFFHEMKIPQPPIISVRLGAFLASGYERKYIVKSASRILKSRVYSLSSSPFAVRLLKSIKPACVRQYGSKTGFETTAK